MSRKSINFEEIERALPLGAFSVFDMEVIYPALKRMKKTDVYLEIGVDKGKSLSFARAVSKGDVFGIDPVDHGGSEVKGANFILGNSEDVDWTLPIQVLFIDGNHDEQYVRQDYEKYWPFIQKGGWVFFHDADITSQFVEKLCKEIGCKFSPNQQCSMAWKRKK